LLGGLFLCIVPLSKVLKVPFSPVRDSEAAGPFPPFLQRRLPEITCGGSMVMRDRKKLKQNVFCSQKGRGAL
jgi:hypothetical protein